MLLALVVSWYLTRRVQRSITAVTTSAAQIADGHYDTRVHSHGLGREFDELAVSVNELARRLEATENTRSRMLADLGHEMRTPVTTLDSYLEALDDGVRTFDDDTRQVLRDATNRLERLAQDITAVSHAEEHLTRIRPTSTATGALVTSAVHAAREQFENKGVTLDARLEDSAAVTVDPDRLGQCWETCSTTPCGTLPRAAPSRSRADRANTDTHRSSSPTPATASRTTSSTISSTASTEWTPPATAGTAAAASA